MSGFVLSRASHAKLEGVHPDLRQVVARAIHISTIDFRVIEGKRTLKRQRELMAAGATRTLNSRHLTGHAVDLAALVGGRVAWDWPLYHAIAEAMKQSARECGVAIEWGGDWKGFRDGPHFQLPWKAYPIEEAA